MSVAGASWTAIYRDGTTLSQYDADHPLAVSGEVPYRAIDWSQIERIVFDSQWVRREFFVFPLDGFKIALRSRHFGRPSQVGTMCFMLVTYPEGATQQDAVNVMYWMPDDTMHSCHDFHCADVLRYMDAFMDRMEGGSKVFELAAEHNLVRLSLDGVAS